MFALVQMLRFVLVTCLFSFLALSADSAMAQQQDELQAIYDEVINSPNLYPGTPQEEVAKVLALTDPQQRWQALYRLYLSLAVEETLESLSIVKVAVDDFARESGDPSIQLITEVLDAYYTVTSGQYVEGEEKADQLLREAIARQNVYAQALAYKVIGLSYSLRGHYFSANINYQFGLSILPTDEMGMVFRHNLLYSLGYSLRQLGDKNGVIETYREVMKISDQYNLSKSYTAIFFNIGEVLLGEVHYAQSNIFIEGLLEIALKRNDLVNAFYYRWALARVELFNQRYDRSLRYLDEMLSNRTPMIDGTAVIFQLYAENLAHLGRIEEARGYLEKAIAEYELSPNLKERRSWLYNTKIEGIIAMNEGRYTDALMLLEQYRTSIEEAFSAAHTSDVESLIEMMNERESFRKEAVSLLEEALVLSQSNQKNIFLFVSVLLGLLIFGLFMRMKANKELRVALKQAQAAANAKSLFLASISHDLRTPLNAIIGFSEMMQNKVFGDLKNAKYDEYVSDINASSRYLLQLVNDILDVTAIESGERTLKIEPVKLSKVFEECEMLLNAMAADKDITLRFACENSEATVSADEKAMIQIITNLVTNAIKFTPNNGTVSVECSEHNGRLKIAVQDNGIGISEEDLKKITQPFIRASQNPLLSYQQGTGLGLAIVLALVGLQNGTMKIDSELGVGTTVTLSFPSLAI